MGDLARADATEDKVVWLAPLDKEEEEEGVLFIPPASEAPPPMEEESLPEDNGRDDDDPGVDAVAAATGAATMVNWPTCGCGG